MRFPSRYVLLVLAPLALSTGCSSRSIFKTSSGDSVFSFKKSKDGEEIAKGDPKAESRSDNKADASKGDSSKEKSAGSRDPKELAAKDKAAAGAATKAGSSKEKTAADNAKLAKAHELEKKGDYDGAARIYREILAEDPKSVAKGAEKKGDTGTTSKTRTASASSDDKPKTLAGKRDPSKSDDPWLKDLEPLPSTNPKADKAGTGAGKSAAVAASASKPDWAKRAADPKTSAADRKLIENAMKSGDSEELDELADLLDIDEEETPAKPVNKFAQREAERKAPSDEQPSEKRVAAKAVEDSGAAPAWAKNRPIAADDVAPAPTGTKDSLPWNRPTGDEGSVVGKAPADSSSDTQPFPWNRDESEKTVVEKESAAPRTGESGPAWKPTRPAQRELAAKSDGPFEKPVVHSNPLEEGFPKQTAMAPALGETASVPSRPGWNATSMERLCRDCDPLVLAQVKKLDNPSADVRKDGIIELTRMGSIARPAGLALRSMLDDADPMVQAYAAWGLWELENETLDSVQVLGGLLGNSRQEVVELACYSLGNMGTTASEAIPALEELRDNSHGVERLRAAEALIRVQGADARSVDVLSVAIKSTDRQVRWIAANGLGHVRGPQATRAIETLTLSLGDSDPEVQAAAALALGGMGQAADKSVPRLEELRRSSTPFVREAADSAIKCLERE